MLREGRPRVSRLVCLSIGLLCLCLVMYMLGSTMTLWTMEFSLDKPDNPLLEGLSLPTIVSEMTPAMPVASALEPSPRPTGKVDEHSLLRPPNPAG
jgi:hypothetical protein